VTKVKDKQTEHHRISNHSKKVTTTQLFCFTRHAHINKEIMVNYVLISPSQLNT